MKRALASVLLVALVTGACGRGTGDNSAVGEATSSVQRIAAASGDTSAARDAINRFALDLLRPNVGSTKGNLAMSPWSIVTALSMTRVGASGTTADEMNRVLHIVDPTAIDASMNALDQQLRSRNGTFPFGDDQQVVELAAANRLFAQQGFRIEQRFLDTVAANYGAGIGLVDYIKAAEAARVLINGWVAEQTRDRIKDLIPDGVLDERTRLVLVNAVYLHADCQSPFDNRATTEGRFHAPNGDVAAMLMHGRETRGWAEGDGWKAVELAYAGNQLAMTVLVPDAGRFDDIAAHLDDAVNQAGTAIRTTEVDLTLPKFDIAKQLRLKEQLAALGMPTAFDDDRADFTGITTQEPIVIADVIHQANVTVDEKGTVAAAATAVIARATSAPAKIEQLIVDRPFFFFLRDKPTGAIVFAGQVTDPSTK